MRRRSSTCSRLHDALCARVVYRHFRFLQWIRSFYVATLFHIDLNTLSRRRRHESPMLHLCTVAGYFFSSFDTC